MHCSCDAPDACATSIPHADPRSLLIPAAQLFCVYDLILAGRRDSDGGGPQAGSRLWDCFPGVHAEVQRQASQGAHFRQPLSIMAPGECLQNPDTSAVKRLMRTDLGPVGSPCRSEGVAAAGKPGISPPPGHRSGVARCLRCTSARPRTRCRPQQQQAAGAGAAPRQPGPPVSCGTNHRSAQLCGGPE